MSGEVEQWGDEKVLSGVGEAKHEVDPNMASVAVVEMGAIAGFDFEFEQVQSSLGSRSMQLSGRQSYGPASSGFPASLRWPTWCAQR